MRAQVPRFLRHRARETNAKRMESGRPIGCSTSSIPNTRTRYHSDSVTQKETVTTTDDVLYVRRYRRYLPTPKSEAAEASANERDACVAATPTILVERLGEPRQRSRIPPVCWSSHRIGAVFLFYRADYRKAVVKVELPRNC